MISWLTKKEQEIIRKHQESVPVTILGMANAFGVAMYKNRQFSHDVSGLIKRNESGSYEIHVNGNYPITRRRFTIAYHLAQLLLYKDEIGDELINDWLYQSSSLPREKEVEALNLAIDILIPRHKLMAEPYRSMSDADKADAFWVSHHTMARRLVQLNSRH